MNGDVLEVDLRLKTAEIQKSLDVVNAQAKDLRKTIKEIELNGGKGGEEWKKYKSDLKDATDQASKLSKELKQMNVANMTIRQLEQHAKDLAKEIKNADRSSQDFVKNSKRLGEVEKELDGARKQAKDLKGEAESMGKPGLWGKISSGVKTVGNAFQAIMALAVLQWIYNLGKAIFDTTGKFEKYEKVLSTALGDQKLAKSSMEAIKKMAAETAFSVDELTDGYVKMVNRGLRPSMKEMVALTDLAASQGKTFDQLVEAVLDAQTGENERLKEFGIKARKEGDNVSLSFKGQTQTVKNNEEAIYQAIIAMGAMTGVAGQNAEMMTTLNGKSSNLGDSFDALTVGLGNGLKPVFIGILDLIAASIPLLSLLGKGLGTVLLLAKAAIAGVLDTVMNVGRAFVTLGEAARAFMSGNTAEAAKLLDEAKDHGKKALTSIEDNVRQGVIEIGNLWVNPDAAVKAEFAGKVQGARHQDALSKEQEKGIAKREKATAKTLEMVAQLEAESEQLMAANSVATEESKIEEKRRKRLKEVNDSLASEEAKEQARLLINKNADLQLYQVRQKDNAKALELLATLEAEHDQKVAANSLAVEESKIEEKRRKRLKEIEASKADESVKTQAIDAINRNAEAELDKVRNDYRQKRQREEAEAAQKRIDAETFIRGQEKIAEMALFDFREMEAKNNAKKLTAIKKERVDTELLYTQQQLAAELLAEQQKAIREIDDVEQLARALNAIEDRYGRESLAAVTKAAAEKVAIDKEYHRQRTENLTLVSSTFKSLLSGDVLSFMDGMGKILAKGNEVWAALKKNDAEGWAARLEMASMAASFLNDLAQKKAQKHIEIAARERDEKLAILQNEMTVTESLITSSSNYVTSLKTAEKERLTALEKALSNETATEEEKRTALKKYYSEQFQQMKAAEEQKIKDLQREANMAKTYDEKNAIEAKIALAKQESAEKIRLAEIELQNRKATIDQITDMATRGSALLIELEKTLSNETATQEEKRQALKKYHSELFQQMKQAEEAKIQDLQRLANEAKTADEKQAIEAKIKMAKEESETKIKLAEDELEKKRASIDKLTDFTTETTESVLKEATEASETQVKLAEDEAQNKYETKADLEEAIAEQNRIYREKETSEKKKAWEAQKKADIATALITGAIAILKALANFFPLNIILAATAGVVTAVQINKIKNQTAPQFEQGGFVARGGKHGPRYSDGGIALIDRRSGQEVGEMEGDEAIVSADQTSANWPIIQQMFRNARTPGKQNTPVIPHPATPLAFRDGGRFESPYFEKGMYLFGTKKKKREAEEMARQAEADAKKAQAEADAMGGGYGFGDAGAYGGIDTGGVGINGDAGAAMAAHEQAQKQGQMQLELLQEIVDGLGENSAKLDKVASAVMGSGDGIQGRLGGVEGAVNRVEGAIYGTNTQGKFDALISAISSMKAA